MMAAPGMCLHKSTFGLSFALALASLASALVSLNSLPVEDSHDKEAHAYMTARGDRQARCRLF